MTDIALRWIADNATADIVVASNDLLLSDDLQSAVIISLFTDRRAPGDLPIAADDRRGWWADTWPDVEGDETGSLLWTITDRGKLVDDAVRLAELHAGDALAWLVDDGVATSVTVTATIAALDQLQLAVSIVLISGAVARYGFVLGGDAESLGGTNAAEVRGTIAAQLSAEPWAAAPLGIAGQVGCGETAGGVEPTDERGVYFDPATYQLDFNTDGSPFAFLRLSRVGPLDDFISVSISLSSSDFVAGIDFESGPYVVGAGPGDPGPILQLISMSLSIDNPYFGELIATLHDPVNGVVVGSPIAVITVDNPGIPP